MVIAAISMTARWVFENQQSAGTPARLHRSAWQGSDKTVLSGFGINERSTDFALSGLRHVTCGWVRRRLPLFRRMTRRPCNQTRIVEVGAMVEAIVPSRAADKFGCGKTYENLMVVNFSGPGGVKASAYCCNVNIDIDGEPQAYGPSDDPEIKPKERLWNGGWFGPGAETRSRRSSTKTPRRHSRISSRRRPISSQRQPQPARRSPPSARSDPAAMAELDKEIEDAKGGDEEGAPSSGTTTRRRGPRYFGEDILALVWAVFAHARRCATAKAVQRT